MVDVPFKTYQALVTRLHEYGRAVAVLGGMNDLDVALHTAAGAIDLLQKHVPESERVEIGGWEDTDLPVELAPGCCSAINPCPHQQLYPDSLCDVCRDPCVQRCALLRLIG